MKFSLGDKVRFLNETGDGLVTKIIGKGMVGVTIEDGFELPFAENELVFADANQVPVQEEERTESRTVSKKSSKEGIYAAVSPQNPENISASDFNLWLINHTGYEVMYSCSCNSESGFELFDKGEIKPYSSVITATISRKALDDYSNVKVDILFFNTKKYDHRPPISEIIKIKQSRLYKGNAFLENDFIQEKALLINVSHLGDELFFDTEEGRNTDLSNLLFQKRSTEKGPQISKPHKKNDLSYEREIDLHIEELIDNYERMSNAEIVQVQLRHFQQALDSAINDHCRTLTVIHGVGNGRLKQEVRSIAASLGLRFYDGSYAKYGFGATDIVIG